MKRLYFLRLSIILLVGLTGCAATALPQQEDLGFPTPSFPPVLLVDTVEAIQRADSLPVTFVRDELEIAIGMIREEVESQTGPVLFHDRTPVTKEITFYKYDGIDVAYRDGAAAAVRLQGGSEWTTNAGIGLGSSREELLGAYGCDLLQAAPNGVHTLSYRISGGNAVAVTWQEFSEGDPFENFYLSINVSQSGVVYDLVLRNRAYVDRIFPPTGACASQAPTRPVL